VIVEQASRLLLNYALLLRQGIGMARVAFWGHGANLQAHRSLALAEAVKKRVSRRPHWWFAYTEGSRHRVRELGYPAERITVVQNAIDTGKLRSARERLGESAAVDTRVRLGLGNGPVAAFVGGLYEDKRLEFLLQVADRLALARPGFHLVVVGDGPLRQTIEREASRRPHVTYCGALFGDEKVAALAPASALLLPGLVGLAILDAFALEIPLVTANVDFHSPEIEYLIDGENGLMVSAANDVQAYVSAVLRVFDDASLSHRLQEGCRAAACRYTNEEMVERFSGGVIQALKAQ
jgi:glycosyltransferase involved in cell wall biosynthesis